MIHISAAGNTMAPCWVALKELGYAVSTAGTRDTEVWIAEKEGVKLQGNGPCMLYHLPKQEPCSCSTAQQPTGGSNPSQPNG